MTAVRQFITYALFPLTFVTAMFAAWWGVENAIDQGILLGAITLSTIVIVALGERLNPEFEHWNQSQDDVGTDLAHGLVSMVLLPPALEAGLKVALFSVSVQLSAWIGADLWPHDWPIALQVAFALVISQFGEYWAHRAMHEVPLLWRLHATHHSPGRLYWLNAARFHPLDTAVLFTIASIPLIVLGAGDEILLFYTAWAAVHGLFQHCNIHLRLGPLNYIFSMAELHRWHHSLKLEEANSNYGNNIIFWDLVFGTFHRPAGVDASEHIGLSEMESFPTDYVGQILSPFRWREIEEGEQSAERG